MLRSNSPCVLLMHTVCAWIFAKFLLVVSVSRYLMSLSKLFVTFQTLKKKGSIFGPFLGHPVINQLFLNTLKIWMITLGAYFPSYFCLFEGKK